MLFILIIINSLIACSNNYYTDSSNNCQACHNLCGNCNGPTALNCTSCQSGYLFGTQCLDTCFVSYYPDPTTNSCLNCASVCATCEGPLISQCLTCNASEPFLLANNCYQTCPSGYYADSSNECQACTIPCATCSGASNNNCLSCLTGFLFQSSCIASCPVSYYLSVSECLPCSTSCRTCNGNNSNNCLSCNSLPAIKYLQNGGCFNICSNGYYLNSLEQCLVCNPQCSTCSGPNSNNCLSCTSGSFLLSNQCFSPCPAGYYGDTSSNKCALWTGSCASNYYTDITNSFCVPCISGCMTCNISPTICTTCAQQYVLQSGYCSSCSANCTNCLFTINNCIQCLAGYTLTKINTNSLSICYPISILQTVIQDQIDNLTFYITFNQSLSLINFPMENMFSITLIGLQQNDFTYNVSQTSNNTFNLSINSSNSLTDQPLIISLNNKYPILDINKNVIISDDFTFNLTSIYSSINISLIYDTNSQYISSAYNSATIYIFLITFSILILTGVTRTLWSFIDIFQMIYCYSFINVDMPSNILQLLIIFLPVNVPFPSITELILSEQPNQETSSYSYLNINSIQKFSDQYHPALFFLRGLSLEVYLVFIILFVLLVDLINFGLKRINFKYRENWSILIIKMKWSLPLRYFLVIYLPLSFCVFLQFYSVDFGNDFSIANIALSSFTLLILVGSIIIAGVLLKKDRNSDNQRRFSKDYQVLIRDFHQYENPLCNYFKLIVMLRKLLFGLSVVLFYYVPSVNLIFLLIQSLIMIVLILKFRPYKRYLFNNAKLIEENVLIIIDLMLIVISQTNIDESQNQSIGYFLIFLIVCIIILYLIMLSHEIYSRCKKLTPIIERAVSKDTMRIQIKSRDNRFTGINL